MSVLSLVNVYKCRPSTLLDIADPYTAYCFDETCTYIIKKIENGEEPTFERKFKTFSEMYRYYEHGK